MNTPHVGALTKDKTKYPKCSTQVCLLPQHNTLLYSSKRCQN